MEKLVLAMSNLQWVPFIGMMAGKSPLTTRLVEASILAFVPIFAGAIWVIPKLEAKIDAGAQIRAAEVMAYAKALDNLADKTEKNYNQINQVATSVAVMNNNIMLIEKKVDSIDDIANTKVRSVEGRLDSLERSLK